MTAARGGLATLLLLALVACDRDAVRSDGLAVARVVTDRQTTAGGSVVPRAGAAPEPRDEESETDG